MISRTILGTKQMPEQSPGEKYHPPACFCRNHSPCHTRQRAQWYSGGDIPEIILPRTDDFQPSLRSGDGLRVVWGSELSGLRSDSARSANVNWPSSSGKGPRRHQFAAANAGARPEIDDVVGMPDRVGVMLDDEHRVAQVAQSFQGSQTDDRCRAGADQCWVHQEYAAHPPGRRRSGWRAECAAPRHRSKCRSRDLV